jgi:hypothetical protein
MTKNWKKIIAEKNIFSTKIASIKDVQATEEAFRP